MWIPESAADIERAARSDALRETASFDAKKSLPIPRKNESLAVDVAAMSTDGGVLLYGVGQDANGQPAIPVPIPLAGAKERIDQIVQTSIAEPPHVEIREYPTDADPSVGYLLIIVPQSARAPHQVTVGGNLRFYGRGPSGNRILTEGEIARLYERRQAWERNREELLTQAIARARFRATADQGFVHAVAAPVLLDPSIWDRAATRTGGWEQLLHALRSAGTQPQIADSQVQQNFHAHTEWEDFGADRVRLSTVASNQDLTEQPTYALDVDLSRDGSAEMTAGGVIWRQYGQASNAVLETGIAGTTASFLALMARLYSLGDYYGHVDIGVAVTGLRGAHSSTLPLGSFAEGRYTADEYRRTERVSAQELASARQVVTRMLRHLFEMTTGDDDFDAFTWTRA